MAKKDEKIKTRPDLDDQHWLVWLGAQPENRGIAVAELYRKMLDWCHKKGVGPTRRRLLKWIESERDAIPMTHAPAYFDAGNAGDSPARAEGDADPRPDCDRCNNERFVESVIDPDAKYDWARRGMIPCPACSGGGQ